DRRINPRVLFLEASDESLVRRFEATRRRHPVAGERVVESIARERELLRELRATADLVLDTSELNVHELRDQVPAAFAGAAGGRHRSVVLAEELGAWLADKGYRANVTHRDMERE